MRDASGLRLAVVALLLPALPLAARQAQAHGPEPSADAARRPAAPRYAGRKLAEVPEWSWVLALAPAFEMDGKSPRELLAWSARESGFELRYADDETRRRAQAARLRGPIRGVRPDEAAAAVLPSTDLRQRLEAGVLWIEASRAAQPAP